MAKNLSQVFCSEKDKVNCPFYFKNGACRYGDQCSRRHLKPTISQTLLFPRMYDANPLAIAMSEGQRITDEEKMMAAVEEFNNFYIEVFMELARYGEIEDMQVCDNLGEHMFGNLYVKFATEEDAANCRNKITGRFYGQKLVVPEFSPVSNFSEGRCRQYEDGTCKRGGHCNFMHLKVVPKDLKKALMKQMYQEHPEYHSRKNKGRGGDRDRDRGRDRDHDRDRDNDKDKDKEKDKDKDRHRDHKDKKKRSRSRNRSRSRDRDRHDRKKKKDRKGSNSRSRSEDYGKKVAKMTSEERRQMIANMANDNPAPQTAPEPQPKPEELASGQA